MDERKQDENLIQEIENRDELRKTARHTWIGDRDEVRPDLVERPVTRMTVPASEIASTRLVEKEKKPYRGFITDEEVEFAEKAAEIDRRARAERMAASEAMTQTRVYTGFGSRIDAEEEGLQEEQEQPKPAKVRRKRTFNISIADNRKFRRLIVLAAAFFILLAFEISFVVMREQISTLPGKTAELKSQTETLTTENEALQKSADELGDYDQIKELRDSWQRIKDRLAE
jgi:cell division protein FtsL